VKEKRATNLLDDGRRQVYKYIPIRPNSPIWLVRCILALAVSLPSKFFSQTGPNPLSYKSSRRRGICRRENNH
jgi:hypothetical protein